MNDADIFEEPPRTAADIARDASVVVDAAAEIEGLAQGFVVPHLAFLVQRLARQLAELAQLQAGIRP